MNIYLEDRRYLMDFDTDTLPDEIYDVLIIGSGIAGIYTALRLDSKLRVGILTKETMDISNSVLAQGGIAVSLGKKDSPELHFKDTLYAGAGLCDEEAVWVLVNEAAENIKKLLEYGVDFDRKNDSELSLTREGAHSMNRIIHAGDSTGKEVLDKLIAAVCACDNVHIHERIFVVDLLTTDEGEQKGVKGVLAFDEDTNTYKIFRSRAVICAAGGFGQIYSNTTNPDVSTGDGVCMAYRAGAKVSNLEFVQFHPTVLFHPENKTFLISEAVRGEGAILRNCHGERFMPSYHELAELAPRDVVSRAIFSEMLRTKQSHVFLDITFKDKEYLEARFPNIYKTCLGYGLDISKDYIPVAPAEHYCMGGVQTDVYGKTNVRDLFAVGEVASNGIHGANRLASNSLLEGLVFGNKIAELLNGTLLDESKKEIQQSLHTAVTACAQKSTNVIDEQTFVDMRSKVQLLMTEKVGMIRDEQGLAEAVTVLSDYQRTLAACTFSSVYAMETYNIIQLALLVAEGALSRRESRGAHYRSDYPQAEEV